MPKTYSTDRDLFPEENNPSSSGQNSTSCSSRRSGETDLPPVDQKVLIKLVRDHYPITAKGPRFGPYRKRKRISNDD